MTAAELLKTAQLLGVRLWAENAALRYEAPKGRMTAALRDQLTAQRDTILAVLTSGGSRRRIVHCADCVHHLPSLHLRQPSGAIWMMPGGCKEGKTSPHARPPIYPSTGWFCETWHPRNSE